MSRIIQIASNAINAKLLTEDRDLKLWVSELMSYEIDTGNTGNRFKSGGWEGRSSFFEFKNGLFPAGFVPLVNRELRRRGYEVQHASVPAPEPLGPAIGTFDPLGYGWDPRYDYQPETVRQLLLRKRLIARLATGAGKSNCAVLAYATIRRPTLFLTTRAVLMHQMKENFAKAGFTAGVLGEGIWKPRRGVNVGMVQSIIARLKDGHPERDKTLLLLSMFELVIGEEAHEVGGNGYYEVMRNCRNAHYRLALTATPFMRNDDEANMRLQAAFGPVGIEVGEKLLIERGILATPYFKFLSVVPPRDLRNKTTWPSCYEIGIVDNPARNKAVCAEAARFSRHGLSVLVLIQRQRHGEMLERMMTEMGLRARFIFGKNEQEERQDALHALANGSIDALIGSTILDVGVDVPSIGAVIQAGGGKAEVRTRQGIGRGLRGKKRDNFCFNVDFEDEGNKILRSHALTRKAIIQNTPGFKEGMLGPLEDFPFAVLENKTKAA